MARASRRHHCCFARRRSCAAFAGPFCGYRSARGYNGHAPCAHWHPCATCAICHPAAAGCGRVGASRAVVVRQAGAECGGACPCWCRRGFIRGAEQQRRPSSRRTCGGAFCSPQCAGLEQQRDPSRRCCSTCAASGTTAAVAAAPAVVGSIEALRGCRSQLCSAACSRHSRRGPASPHCCRRNEHPTPAIP